MDETSAEVPSWRVALELLYRGASSLFYWTIILIAFLAVCIAAFLSVFALEGLSMWIAGIFTSLFAVTVDAYNSNRLLRIVLKTAWFATNVLLWVVFIAVPVFRWLRGKWTSARNDLVDDQ